MATVEIGYDARCYVTFEIANATANELDVLRMSEQNDYVHNTFEMLRAMQEDGRLTRIESSLEDSPDPFGRNSDPNIINVTEED